MATRKKESGLRDPFRKWNNSTEAVAAINTPLSASKIMLGQLTKQIASPGLSREARAVLLKAISEAKKDIKKHEIEAKKAVKDIQDQQRIQMDILYKLNALRTQMSRKDLSQEVLTTLVEGEKRLEKLLVATKNLNIDNLSDMLKEVHESQKALESLPDDINQALTDQDDILERVLASQDEAREFLRQQRADLKNLGKKIGKGFLSLGMDLADKLGVGGVVRGIGAVGRGIRAGYRGAKYVAKTISSMRKARGGGGEEGETKDSRSIAEKFSDYVAHTRLFQRRMMRSAEKKESGDKSVLSAILGIGPLLKGVGMLFGAGGMIATLIGRFAGIFKGKLLPALGGLLRGGLRILGPIGALASAFGAGHWLGSKIYKMIEEPVAKAIDYFFLKNHETGKTGLGQDVADVKDKISGLPQPSEVMNSIGGAAKEKWNDVRSTVSSLPSPSQTLSAAGEAVGSAASSAGAAVSSAAGSAKESMKSGGRKVKDWIGTLFKTGGSVDVDGLNSKLQGNLIDMARDYHDMTGKKLQINSAYRSPEKQAELYRTLPKGRAAPPGRSLHEHGLAFDLQSSQGNELAKLGLLSKHGFDRPISKEPWHIQPQGVTLASAKAGLYSADGPVNQGSSTPVTQSISQTDVPTQVAMKGPSSGSGMTTGKGSASGQGGGQPSSRVGVNDIPTFDMSDGMFLAMNIGSAA